MRKMALFLATASVALSSSAQAALIIDQSPDVIGLTAAVPYSNIATGQNWLMKITLASATTLDGIDIYSGCRAWGCFPDVGIGTNAIVKIRNDSGGAPASFNLFSLGTMISAIDSDGSAARPLLERVHADFSATTLAAGDYWIGLSGDAVDIGVSQRSGASSGLYQLAGDSLASNFSAYSNPYRIYGDVLAGPIPEPSSWALTIAGFGLVGGAMRRRRTVRVTYA